VQGKCDYAWFEVSTFTSLGFEANPPGLPEIFVRPSVCRRHTSIILFPTSCVKSKHSGRQGWHDKLSVAQPLSGLREPGVIMVLEEVVVGGVPMKPEKRKVREIRKVLDPSSGLMIADPWFNNMEADDYANEVTRIVGDLLWDTYKGDSGDKYWGKRIWDVDHETMYRGTVKIVGAEMSAMLAAGKLTPTSPLSDQETAQIVPFIQDICWEDIILGVFENSVSV
jgi:hypothetical protein